MIRRWIGRMMQRSTSAKIAGHRAICAAMLVTALTGMAACAADSGEPEPTGLMSAAYDPETGRLQLIEYDSDENGVVDIWTYMDGSRLLRIEIDADEDGRMERWEYYDEARELEKVGSASANDGVVDTWAHYDLEGQIAMLELSSGRDGTVDRWQYYEGGAVARVEQDTTGDGVVDRWETFEAGILTTVSFDENGNGRPDRRMTYNEQAELVSIESEPDENGEFARTVTVLQEEGH